MKKPETILEWATFYREKGFNVIPLYNFSKGPTMVETWDDDFGWIPGWEPLQSRTSTLKEFDHWFREGKTPTGIALITGKISGVVVVDEDSYKTGGMRFHLTSKLRSKTANGGSHYFFKYSEDVKTSGFKQGVNIEIKSDGGIVVLPPSKVYQKGTKNIGEYIWVSTQKLAHLPTINSKELYPYTKEEREVLSVKLHEYMNATEGYRHNSLRTIANSVFNKFPEEEWDLAVDFIKKAAADFSPPPPEKDVDNLIRDCMSFIRNNPKTSFKSNLGNKGKSVIAKPKTLNEIKLERMDEKELEKIAPKTGYPELDNLIIGFIPGHLYTVTGDTNVGKTSLACNFAVSVAKQKKRVLYFALEPENSVIDYLASVKSKKEFSDINDADYDFEGYDIFIYGKQEISTPEDLISVVKSSTDRWDLIIIDHIGYFIKDKANTNQEQSNVVKQLAGLAKQMKTAIIMIAHLRKRASNQKQSYTPTADDISGSGAFKQDSTEVIIVTRPPKDNNADTFELSDDGFIYVAKTKCGPNGRVPIHFSNRKAKIFSDEELLNYMKSQKNVSLSQYLTSMGFPDKKD